MKGTPDAQCRPLQDCHIAEESLALFSTFVASQMGLLFTRRQWGMLRRGICAAADEFGFRDPEACMHWLMSSSLTREQVETLAGTLTVGETYFWREEKSLDALREEVIPALMRARSGDERHLRIWSAGCSSGEEPYSIAILLHRMGTALRDWRVTIHATDINPRALARAREGIYGEWSFRTTPAWVRNGYFRRRSDGKLEVIPEIRTMVEFAYLNLADDVYPLLFNNTNAMDLILCRNVLMYFAPELAQKVVSRFHRCLVAGGWLVVSPCEISPQLFSRFGARNFGDMVLYQKKSAGEEGRGEVKGADLVVFPHVLPAVPVPDLPPSTPEIVGPAAEAGVSPVGENATYEKGVDLYRQGRYAEAAEVLAAFLAEHDDDARPAALLCRINANQGKLGEALHFSERALAADKLDAGLHYLHAVILQEQGAVDGAAGSLKRALYLDPDMVIAHFALGNLFLQQGKRRDARRYFNNALAILGTYGQDDILPESEGIAAGRLMDIIRMIDAA